MNTSTHQTAAVGGTAFAVALIVKAAAHYGYTIDADTAVEIIGLASGAAVYVTQFLAARGVKLPPLPAETAPVTAPAQP